MKGHTTVIYDKGWYANDVVVDPFRNLHYQTRYWIEDSGNYDDLRVPENPMKGDDVQISYVLHNAYMGFSAPVCSLRLWPMFRFQRARLFIEAVAHCTY